MAFRFFYILIFFFLSIELNAQGNRCGTDEVFKRNQIENPEIYKSQLQFREELTEKVLQKKFSKTSASNVIYTIPVVVHVVHNNSSGTIGGPGNGNISDAQIQAQIDILNEDYRRKAGTNGANSDPLSADAMIEFCLASSDPDGNFTTGITRTYNSKAEWAYGASDEVNLKKLVDWPCERYLNIWVTKLSGGILGYATYPTNSALSGIPQNTDAALDGVVVDYRTFGKGGATVSPYNLGRTTTHEVGHWLGLLHIWGDQYCGNDFVSDTPPDQDANDDLDCMDFSDCDGDGIKTADLTNDYMDYSKDQCMNLFTAGQAERMRTAIETSARRKALLSSPGCCASKLVAMPIQQGFESDDMELPKWLEYYNNVSNKWDTATVGNNSGHSIFIDNSTANLSDSSFIISPFLSLKDQNPGLSFDLAYAEGILDGTDTLAISYSIGCNDWKPLIKYYGNNLITTTERSNNFIPKDSSWKNISIALSPFAGAYTGKIRFENHSAKKNKIYIDNINIYHIKTSKTLVVTPYPNPAEDILSLEILFDGERDITIEIFDMLGQKIYSVSDDNKTNYIRKIDVSGFAKGLYILRVSGRGERVSKKILVKSN